MKGSFESRPRLLAIVAALWMGTFCLYWPVHQFDFLSYDDGDYVTNNPHVVGGLTAPNIRWAFSHFHSSNWHPLTWLSHMTDVTFFGLNPGAHHLINVILHGTNAVLLFLLLNTATGAMWRSAFVAAVFAWHPLHVESVAWISERKDVLSVFFCLLLIGAYVRYVRTGSRLCYFLVLFLDAAALLAKPIAVVVPALLLLLDYWPLQRADLSRSHLRRWVTLALEKMPLLILSAVSCIVAIKAQESSGSLISSEQMSFLLRLENAAVSYTAYLGSSLWPVNLAVFYPMAVPVSVAAVAGATVLLIIGTLTAILWRKEHPYFLTGWLWFVCSLIPVIGLVQVGPQARADRYMYLPLIGLTIIFGWGLPKLLGGLTPKPARAGAILGTGATLVLIALITLTVRQLGYWQNSISLFEHALAVTQGNWFAHGHLATSLARRGRIAEAIQHYRELLQLRPDSADALNNLAWHLSTASDPQLRNGPEALDLAQRAVALAKGNEASTLDTFAAALAENGRFGEAAGTAQRALAAARANGDASLTSGIEMRLNLYRSGAPYHQ